MNKILLLIILSMNLSFIKAQIIEGEYLPYGKFTEFGKMVILPNNHFQFITEKDTIGGLGTEKNGVIMATKYQINHNLSPSTIDLIFYDKKTGQVFNTMEGLYKKINDKSFALALDFMGTGRPNKIDENDPLVSKYIINNAENYISLLKINSTQKIKGFNPEVKENQINGNSKEIIYLQNGKPLKTDEFQYKEVHEFNESGQLTEIKLYNHKGQLFTSSEGYCIKRIEYNNNSEIIKEQYLNNKEELITFNGTLFPEIIYTYEGVKLIQIDRLVNNSKYLKTTHSKTKFFYDSYGDRVSLQKYFHDGKPVPDTLQDKVIEGLENWIIKFAKFPETYKPILIGNANPSWTIKSGEKVPNSDEYKLYIDFHLNDSTNNKSRFSGYIKLDYNFDVIAVHPKNRKIENPSMIEWSSTDFDDWFNTFCRELTKEELAQKELEEKQIIKELINTLNEATNDSNPNVYIDGDVDKKDIKKVKKSLKKLENKNW